MRTGRRVPALCRLRLGWVQAWDHVHDAFSRSMSCPSSPVPPVWGLLEFTARSEALKAQSSVAASVAQFDDNSVAGPGARSEPRVQLAIRPWDLAELSGHGGRGGELMTRPGESFAAYTAEVDFTRAGNEIDWVSALFRRMEPSHVPSRRRLP